MGRYIDSLVLHHTYTKDGLIVDFNAIKNYHMNVLGWIDIGYHYVIEVVGDQVMVLTGRDEEVIGAHARGFNEHSIGIAIVGNFERTKPSEKLLNALMMLIAEIFSRRGVLKIYGHREVKTSRTNCPGRYFPLEEVKAKAHAINEKKDYKGHWAEKYIDKVRDEGLMNGYEDGSFKPDEKVTRAQLAVILAKLLERDK